MTFDWRALAVAAVLFNTVACAAEVVHTDGMVEERGVGVPVKFYAGCMVRQAVADIGQAMEDGNKGEAIRIAETPSNMCFKITDPTGTSTYGMGIVTELDPHIYIVGPNTFMQVAQVQSWNGKEIYTLVPALPLPGFEKTCGKCEDV